MTRALWICFKIAVVVVAGVFLADNTGTVTIEEFGWRVDAPVGLLVLAVVLIAYAFAVIYRLTKAFLRSPQTLGRRFQGSRRQRGYKALNQGMVAVAAGDAGEAARWARKADSLLDEPPLTMLLSAQAAQLNGDDKAAKRYFKAMLENDETRFLGLRGLVMQALREGEQTQALDYVRQAQALRPKTPWVATTLFELSERTGDLEAAGRALTHAVKLKALPQGEATAKHIALLLQRALDAVAAGDKNRALKLAREAHKLAPEVIPQALILARLALAAGQDREAKKVVERAWTRNPHPELAALYLSLPPAEGALEQVKRLKHLVAVKPQDPESHLALAEASLAAKLWGEARRHLEAAGGEAPTARICRLWARLAEAENGDEAAARRWLERAGTAPADATWVCESCGATAEDWSARCGACDAFNTLTWRPPTHAGAAPRVPPPEATPALPARTLEPGAGPPAPVS
jgi:HemY protein